MSEKEQAMTDPREALVALLGEHVDLTDRAAEDGCSCGMRDPSRFERHVADAILAAGRTPPGADPREVAHVKCDCVPALGPPHCHLCSTLAGTEVPWDEAHRTLPSVEDVAQVLDGHRPIEDGRGAVIACGCGVRYGVQHPESESRSAHLARAVLALFPGRTEAEVKAEALREAAEQLEAHGRFDVPVWTLLRDRAARIEGGGDRG